MSEGSARTSRNKLSPSMPCEEMNRAKSVSDLSTTFLDSYFELLAVDSTKTNDVPREKNKKTFKDRRSRHIVLNKSCQLSKCPEDKLSRLLSEKIKMCSAGKDGYSHLQSLTDVKLVTLYELSEFVRSREEIPVSSYPVIFDMFSSNVFRDLPPPSNPLSNESDLEEEEDSYTYANDPNWHLLQRVYYFFLDFLDLPRLNVFICKRFINPSFIVSLLKVFNSENREERHYLKNLLHKIYWKFVSERAFIRKQLHYLFYTFIYEESVHYGISELLEVISSIISGFLTPIKAEHKTFLLRTLLPLHTPRIYPMYSSILMNCVVQFIKKEPELTVPVVKSLLKYWPKVNYTKQLLFLSEIENILISGDEVVNEVKKVKIPLAKQICSCASDPHFQVAEKALSILKGNEFLSLLNEEDCNNINKLYPNICIGINE